MRKGFRKGCGPERIPGRADLPSLLPGGFVWSERVLEVLAPGFGPEGVGLQLSKSVSGGWFRLARRVFAGVVGRENIGPVPEGAVGAERRRIAVALEVGFVWRGGRSRWRQVDALLHPCDFAGL